MGRVRVTIFSTIKVLQHGWQLAKRAANQTASILGPRPSHSASGPAPATQWITHLPHVLKKLATAQKHLRPRRTNRFGFWPHNFQTNGPTPKNMAMQNSENAVNDPTRNWLRGLIPASGRRVGKQCSVRKPSLVTTGHRFQSLHCATYRTQ